MTIEKRLPEMTREKRRLEITMGKNSLSFLGSEPFVISRERTICHFEGAAATEKFFDLPEKISRRLRRLEMTREKRRLEMTMEKRRLEMTREKRRLEMTMEKRRLETIMGKRRVEMTMGKKRLEMAGTKRLAMTRRDRLEGRQSAPEAWAGVRGKRH
jgi:hypothetical protein